MVKAGQNGAIGSHALRHADRVKKCADVGVIMLPKAVVGVPVDGKM